MKTIRRIITTMVAYMLFSVLFTLEAYAEEKEKEKEEKSPYSIEVFGDAGADKKVGERTQNTGYNIHRVSSKYNNAKYQSIPVIDCSAERIGLDYAGYSYYGGNHYSYNAFKTLKDNGCDYVLLLLGQSNWNNSNKFTPKSCTNYAYVMNRAISNARNAGVKVGLFWEGNAVNSMFAFDEADYICSLIRSYNIEFDLPLFYAPEYSSNANVYENRTQAVKSFFSRMQYNKYKGKLGLYSNGNTNQGAIIKINEICDYVPDLCVWVPGYDNMNCRPNYDNLLYMHQYTGNYSIVPERKKCTINGVGYQVDISMAFVERPENVGDVYIQGNYISWNTVYNADSYKVCEVKNDGTYHTTITTNNYYTTSNNTVKVFIKALRTDKFGFTAESYKWAETKNSWKTFDFDTIDLTKFYTYNSSTNYKYTTNIISKKKYELIANSTSICYDTISNLINNSKNVL